MFIHSLFYFKDSLYSLTDCPIFLLTADIEIELKFVLRRVLHAVLLGVLCTFDRFNLAITYFCTTSAFHELRATYRKHGIGIGTGVARSHLTTLHYLLACALVSNAVGKRF